MARPKMEHPAQVMSARVPYELAQLTRKEAAALGVRVSARIRDGLRAVAGLGSSEFEKKAVKELVRAAEKGTIAAVADVAGELLALAPNAKAAAHIEATAEHIAEALSAAISKTHKQDKAAKVAKLPKPKKEKAPKPPKAPKVKKEAPKKASVVRTAKKDTTKAPKKKKPTPLELVAAAKSDAGLSAIMRQYLTSELSGLDYRELLDAITKKRQEIAAARREASAKGAKTAGGTLPAGEVERDAAYYVAQLHKHLAGRPRNKSEVKERLQALRAAGMARTKNERDALYQAQSQELKRIEDAGRMGGGMFGEPIKYQQLLTARSVPELDRIQDYLLKTYPDEAGAIKTEARDVRKRGNLPEKEVDRRSTGTPIARDFTAEQAAALAAEDARYKAKIERLGGEALAEERRLIMSEMGLSTIKDDRKAFLNKHLAVVRAEQTARQQLAASERWETPAQRIEAKKAADAKAKREAAAEKAAADAEQKRLDAEAKATQAAIAAEQKKNEAYLKRKAAEDAKEAKEAAKRAKEGCEGPGCEYALQGGKCSVKAPLVVGAKEGGVFSAPARYCLIELDQLKPSHNSLRSYSRTPGYPIAAQERDYEHERGEQAKVQTIADNYEPSLVFNNAPGAIDGLPVANEQGIVLGGNGRTMATALVYGGYAKHANADTIKTYLKAHIKEFGFTEKQLSEFAKPMIVRTVRTGTDDVQELAGWSRRLNQSMSQALNPTLIAVSRARFLDPDALSELANLPDDETINAWLSSNASRGFVRSLEKSGVIDTRNSPTFLVPGGLLSPAGRDLVNDLLVAVLIPDADLIRALGPGTTGTLAKAAPYLAQLAPLKEYNILPEFTLALRDLVSLRAQGFTDVPRFLEQRGMFGVDSKVRGNPIAEVWLFILLELQGSPAKLAKLARYYLGLAKAPSSGQAGLFAAETFTPQQALERAAKVAGVKL